jgi:hypothetical protein
MNIHNTGLNRVLTINEAADLLLKYFLNHPAEYPTYTQLVDSVGSITYPNITTVSMAFNMLIVSGVINSNGGNNYSLTGKGYEIMAIGSWTKYIEHEAAKRDLELEYIRTGILNNKTTSDILKKQTVILSITAVIACLALIVSGISAYYSYKADAKVNEIKLYLLPESGARNKRLFPL